MVRVREKKKEENNLQLYNNSSGSFRRISSEINSPHLQLILIKQFRQEAFLSNK